VLIVDGNVYFPSGASNTSSKETCPSFSASDAQIGGRASSAPAGQSYRADP